MPIQSLDRDVEMRLEDRDVRYTRGRRKVVAALHEADGHHVGGRAARQGQR